MNLEQLQAMSDTELNELSAVKVMGKIYQNEHLWEEVEGKGINGHRCLGAWNPTTDMNDAMRLEEAIIYKQDDGIMHHVRYIDSLALVLGIDNVKEIYGYGQLRDLIRAAPKQRTIASILTKE